MSASKNRPRRISEPTRTYNAIFPVGLLEDAGAAAELQRVSLAEFVREAVRTATKKTVADADTVPWDVDLEAVEGREPVTKTDFGARCYNDGAVEACRIILDSTRLKIRMATGQTIGEDLVARIKKDLGVTP